MYRMPLNKTSILLGLAGYKKVITNSEYRSISQLIHEQKLDVR